MAKEEGVYLSIGDKIAYAFRTGEAPKKTLEA